MKQSVITVGLVGDGTSDQLLFGPIRWVGNKANCRLNLEPYDSISKSASRLSSDISHGALDLLIVHRDAEKQAPQLRKGEIEAFVSSLPTINWIPVVPVRMTESWFLFDETALRAAAGNPAGKCPLNLPKLNKVESDPNSKETIKIVLEQATELSGRRLKSFSWREALHRLPDLIEDYSPLEVLPAFADFSREMRAALNRLQGSEKSH